MVQQTYKFNVKMTCGGCSGAVTRALSRAKDNNQGIDDFTVSLEKQEVIVHASIPFEDVRAKIAKTGKEVISGETVPVGA